MPGKPRASSGRADAAAAATRALVLEQMRHEQEAAGALLWQKLDALEQQRLAWEVASSRADELRLAFPALLAIGAGFRVRNEQPAKPRARGARLGPVAARGELTEEPTVVFTVARKWKSLNKGSRRGKRAGELPKCLLAYADDPTGSGSRVLIAVPTDVRDRARVLVAVPSDVGDRPSARPRALQGLRGTIAARSEGLDGQLGILTCAVRLPGRSALFAMGAHHVLAMSLASGQPGVPVDHANIILRKTDAEIGRLVSQPIGSLLPGQVAMDAALAEVSAASQLKVLRDATAGMVASDIWHDPGAFPLTCHVLVGLPENFLRARFVQRRIVFGDDSGEVVYFGVLGSEPLHPVMLELWIDETAPRSTEPGESGCPVVTDDGKRLVGMHIGGVIDSRTIWAIPATELFLASRWKLPAPPTLVPL